MRLKFSELIKNIESYYLSHFGLIYKMNIKSGSESLYINDVRIVEANICDYLRNKNHLLYSTYENKIYQHTNGNDELICEGKSLGYKTYMQVKALFTERIERGVYNHYFYDLEKRKLERIEEVPICDFNDSLFYLLENTLSCKSSGKNWEVGLNIFGSFVKIVKIVNKILWLTSRIGNESHCLIGLNVDEGTVKFFGENYSIKYAHSTSYIKEVNSVLCLHGFSRFEPETEYKEFDAGTGKIIRQGVVDSLLMENLVLKDWSCHDGRIYFTAIREEKFPTHIGVLDYETLNLLDYIRVDTSPGHFLPAGAAPVVNDGKLYILDGGGTLHIYNIKE